VFLKYFHVEQLNSALSEFTRRVVTCQKYARGVGARRSYATVKQLARKCEADVNQLSVIVRKLADDLTFQQNELHKEDARLYEEKLNAANEPEQQGNGTYDVKLLMSDSICPLFAVSLMSDNTNPLQRFDTVGCATGRKGIRPVQNSASAVPKGFPLDVRPNLELSQKKGRLNKIKSRRRRLII